MLMESMAARKRMKVKAEPIVSKNDECSEYVENGCMEVEPSDCSRHAKEESEHNASTEQATPIKPSRVSPPARCGAKCGRKFARFSCNLCPFVTRRKAAMGAHIYYMHKRVACLLQAAPSQTDECSETQNNSVRNEAANKDVNTSPCVTAAPGHTQEKRKGQCNSNESRMAVDPEPSTQTAPSQRHEGSVSDEDPESLKSIRDRNEVFVSMHKDEGTKLPQSAEYGLKTLVLPTDSTAVKEPLQLKCVSETRTVVDPESSTQTAPHQRHKRSVSDDDPELLKSVCDINEVCVSMHKDEDTKFFQSAENNFKTLVLPMDSAAVKEPLQLKCVSENRTIVDPEPSTQTAPSQRHEISVSDLDPESLKSVCDSNEVCVFMHKDEDTKLSQSAENNFKTLVLPVDSAAVKEPVQLKCQVCPFVTQYQAKLFLHTKEHASKQKVYSVNHFSPDMTKCNTSYTQPHTSKTPFRCNECPCIFAYYSSLVAHRRKHTC
ncbi:gastrula zinc finger protein XlCGF48.2-like isoform X1 [Dermacentor albipictus]|uniref:gastrula zinc finger protein XlCGF48.2-like isoform X1 n=2 Tax=Dermacentor albipictus TaxID=60249 RepID=UPI0031FC42E4